MQFPAGGTDDSGEEVDEAAAVVGDDSVIAGSLDHLGGGIYALAIEFATDDPADGGAGGFEVEVLEGARSAADEFTQVEHDRMVELASAWMERHVRRITRSDGTQQAGDIVVSERPIRRRVRADWLVRSGAAARFDRPVTFRRGDVAPAVVQPGRSPREPGDESDMAVLCATVAGSTGMKVAMAVAGDVSRESVVGPVADLDARLSVARGRIRHVMVSADERLFPGRRTFADGAERVVWTAWEVHDGLCTMFDAAAGESAQRDHRPRGPRLWSRALLVLSVVLFVSAMFAVTWLAIIGFAALVLAVVTTPRRRRVPLYRDTGTG